MSEPESKVNVKGEGKIESVNKEEVAAKDKELAEQDRRFEAAKQDADRAIALLQVCPCTTHVAPHERQGFRVSVSEKASRDTYPEP